MAVVCRDNTRRRIERSLFSQSLDDVDALRKVEVSFVVIRDESVRALDDHRIQFEIAQREPRFVRPYAGIGRVEEQRPVSLDDEVVGIFAGPAVHGLDRCDRKSAVLEGTEGARDINV